MSARRAHSRARRRALGCLCGLLLGSVAGNAAATDTLDMTVSTLLTGHADPRDGLLHTVVPVYESLSVLMTVQRPYTDGIRLVFSGWGGLLWEYPNAISWTGDIDIGYLEGSFLRRRLLLRIGRQLVIGGAARNAQIDGVSATVRIVRGLSLTGYAGAPVTPRFGLHRGDFIFGGRMSYRHSIETELGISFNQILDGGQIARQDLGVDAHYVPQRTLMLSGYALFAIPAARLAEVDVSATFLPRPMVQLALDYRRTAPDLFLPMNSIFTVFSQETRDELGVTAYLRPIHRLRLYGDYHTVFNMEGIGHRGGAKLTLALGNRDHTTLNVELRLLLLPSNGYRQARLYSVHRLSAAFLATFGLDAYVLEQAINGQNYSFTAHSSIGYDFGKGFRLVATGMADVTPFVASRFEFMTRLAYNVTRRFREVHP